MPRWDVEMAGQLHTVAEAAAILKVRESWLKTKAAAGRIPSAPAPPSTSARRSRCSTNSWTLSAARITNTTVRQHQPRTRRQQAPPDTAARNREAGRR